MRLSPALSFVALALCSFACSSSDSPGDENQVPVSAKLVSLTISDIGAVSGLMPTKSLQLSATGQYDDGTKPDLSDRVVFSSSDANIATVAGRTLTAIAPGTVEIRASFEEIFTVAALTIEPATVKDIVLTPNDVNMARGETINLTATLRWSNDTEEDATSRVTWSSSLEAGISVDSMGLVTAHTGGEATITATLDGVSSTAFIYSTCSYPQGPSAIEFGAMMPNLYWGTAFDKAGNETAFSLEEVHCSSAWKDVTALFFIISAGWCPNCPDYVRNIAAQLDTIEAAGGRFILVEVQDNSYAPGDSADAKAWLQRIVGPNVAMGVGDSDVEPTPGVWGSSPMVIAFPSTIVVRTSDMKIIADQMRSNYILPFAQIARHTDVDWSNPASVVIENCGPEDQEASEPNDRPYQAADLEPGESRGGICTTADDYYQVSVEGRYKISLDFDHSLGDLDIYAWDDVTNQALEINGVKVGSYGSTGHEEFEHSGRAVIRVDGFQGATAPYVLTLQAL